MALTNAYPTEEYGGTQVTRTSTGFIATRKVKAFGFLSPEWEFIRHMDQCKSFDDTYWSDYWTALANEQLWRVDNELKKASLLEASHALFCRQSFPRPSPDVFAFLSRGAAAITQTPPGVPIDAGRLHQSTSEEERSSSVAVSSLLKAIAYLFVAAWPGHTPERMKAYCNCGDLFHILLDAVAPIINLTVERHQVKTNGEEVNVYALLPNASTAGNGTLVPGVLVTNGLEGTNVETMATALRTQAIQSSAWFFMEMPGTYAYKKPMTKASSERIYGDVLSFIASHKSVDASRLGMIGVSFGGNCTTRMAIADKRLKAVVINGAPLARSLGPLGSFGMPEIVARTLFSVLGAQTLLDLKKSLHDITPSRAYIESIDCNVLAVNGENDTLISTQDTVDLAAWAPNSELVLYPGDDHCAMGHIREFLEYGSQWLDKNLSQAI
ncbi:alpha/beta-hydrolase [Colletotrichum eremochloae]|nr:alpha/beta-hydrolase [Colletotrichum eremochloae]